MGSMKKLLEKSLRPIIIYALVVLVMSIPAYFLIIDWIWQRELDKHHYAIREKLESRIHKMNLPDSELEETIAILNEVQPGFSFTPANSTISRDSLYTLIRFDEFMQDREQFRCLQTHIRVNGKQFGLLIETNMEEIDETILALSAITFFFMVLLLAGFIWLNRKTSLRIWKPFYSSLARIKAFELDKAEHVTFEKSAITEFNALNESLDKLIGGNIASYKQQKEFTENASHELQTPLAVVKSKLDLLIQSQELTGNQMHLAEEAGQAINRVSRINKNLLLLSKIENAQFTEKEEIQIKTLLSGLVAEFSDHFASKELILEQHGEINPNMEANRVLVEVLFTNLLVNAVRYTPEEGLVRIDFKPWGVSISNTGHTSLDTRNLFKRFAQASAGHVGSGLGLAIVKQICNRYGWQISYAYENKLHNFSITF